MAKPNEEKKASELGTEKPGTLVVLGSSPIGTIQSKNGNIQVRLAEVTIHEKIRRYKVDVTVFSNYPANYHTSQLAYEEIASLLVGIDHVSKADKSATKLDTFEMRYLTDSNLKVIAFNMANSPNEVSFSIYSGNVSVDVTPYMLLRFKTLIIEAKQRIDSLKKGVGQ